MNLLVVLVEGQGGHSRDLVLFYKFCHSLLVNINFDKSPFPSVVFLQLRDDRGKHFARLTPVSIEVDEIGSA